MKTILVAFFLVCSLAASSQVLFKPGNFNTGDLVRDSSGVVWQARKVIAKATVSPKPGASWLLIGFMPIVDSTIFKRIEALERIFNSTHYKTYSADSIIWSDGTLLGNGSLKNPFRLNPNIRYVTIP